MGCDHPVYQALEEIVKALLPRDIDARSLKLHCLGILGQCLVHRVCREMIDRLKSEIPIWKQECWITGSTWSASTSPLPEANSEEPIR